MLLQICYTWYLNTKIPIVNVTHSPYVVQAGRQYLTFPSNLPLPINITHQTDSQQSETRQVTPMMLPDQTKNEEITDPLVMKKENSGKKRKVFVINRLDWMLS